MAPPSKPGKNGKPGNSGVRMSGADKVKALRLRSKVRVGAPLTPEETAWLSDYEQRVQGNGAVGGSRRHVVESTFREEQAEAVGTGDAAAVAAAGVYAREEGRRYDMLLEQVIKATETVTKMYAELGRVCLDRAKEDGQTLRELMVSVRHHYLERTELEADAIRREAEEDGGLGKLAEQLAPFFGIKLPGSDGEQRRSNGASRRGRPV